jgi:hypothetical protein
MDSNFLGSLLADSEWPMNGISCSSGVDGLYCAVNVPISVKPLQMSCGPASFFHFPVTSHSSLSL